MKELRLIVLGIVLLLASLGKAQVSVSLNIGSPPPWGPVGYTDVRYYYLPDVQAYYDVQSSMFIYQRGGAWVHRTYLPSRYRNYDLYGGYKVVMSDYRGDAPYSHFKEHRMKYARGYRGEEQRTVGDRPGRGNSGANFSHNDNRGNRGNGRGNDKNIRHDNQRKMNNGNDRNMKKDHGNGDKNGKRK